MQFRAIFEEQVRARKNCGKLYQKLWNACNLIMNDEEYFKLTENNVVGNCYFYSTYLLQKSTSNVQAKMMVWMSMSFKDASNHESKQTVNQETYLKECIDKRLLLQISFE